MGLFPDLKLTPGAINQQITQANINQTLCNPNWSTKSERPPATYTTKLKIQQLTQYGYSDKTTAKYEEDHLISLELGGNPTDPKNLWPEPYNITYNGNPAGAKLKDSVENYLHKQLCDGGMTLSQVQAQIVKDWYSIYTRNIQGTLGMSISLVDEDDQ